MSGKGLNIHEQYAKRVAELESWYKQQIDQEGTADVPHSQSEQEKSKNVVAQTPERKKALEVSPVAIKGNDLPIESPSPNAKDVHEGKGSPVPYREYESVDGEEHPDRYYEWFGGADDNEDWGPGWHWDEATNTWLFDVSIAIEDDSGVVETGGTEYSFNTAFDPAPVMQDESHIRAEAYVSEMWEILLTVRHELVSKGNPHNPQTPLQCSSSKF